MAGDGAKAAEDFNSNRTAEPASELDGVSAPGINEAESGSPAPVARGGQADTQAGCCTVAGIQAAVSKWWTRRKMERNKDFGMDPYVKVRIGRHGKPARTACIVSKQGDNKDVYLNPVFTDAMSRELTVRRSPGDRGELIVEVLDEGLQKDGFVGACHEDVIHFIEFAQTSPDWKPTMFHILDHQLGEIDVETSEDERDAGAVSALVRWVPNVARDGQTDSSAGGASDGFLKVKILSCSELRDISAIHISDIASFADTGYMKNTVAMFVFFLTTSSVYFSRLMDWPMPDATLFVVATFTTVGFGDHPSRLETPTERMSTVVFIVLGIAVLGVTIGTVVNLLKVKVDQAKRRARESMLRKMNDDHEGGAAQHDHPGGVDQLKMEVLKDLQKKYPGQPVDEHLMQKEMGAAVLRHFWTEEVQKVVISILVLFFILLTGTVVFMQTEGDVQYGCTPEKHVGNPDYCTCALDEDNGDVIACYTTGLTFVDALYFTTVTASTVGYGDLSPRSEWGKLFAIIYIPFAVGLMSKTIMTVALIPAEFRQLKLESFVLDQFGNELSAPDFADLKVSVNLSPDADITKNDFTLAMLLRLGRIGTYDITRIEQIFERLDKDKNGSLSSEDVQDLLTLQRQRLARHELDSGHAMMPNHIWNPSTGAPLNTDQPAEDAIT